MNYEKLVNRLRRKAFDYNGHKAIQFSQILKEAVKRKIASSPDNGYGKRQEALLRKTN